MNRFLPVLLSALIFSGCTINQNQKTDTQTTTGWDSTGTTNDFYDNTETHSLKMVGLYIGGEVGNPGRIDLSTLPVRSVFVKETLLDSAGSDRFVGAYRYDGYSLFDILNKTVLRKANTKEFNPIIDLFVEIENDWGEIYYPSSVHRIIIARSVSRIVPSKTKDLWPLPQNSKIVAANDLITERNISNPARITVRSYPVSLPVTRGISSLYSKSFNLFDNGKKLAEITPDDNKAFTYNTIFYGRGKGIHSTSPFSGVLLKDIIRNYYPMSKDNLQKGVFCLAAIDGYRCTITYSELFNRNDQQEFLLLKTKPGEDGGLYRTFPAQDFFSDRAIKSLTSIYLIR